MEQALQVRVCCTAHYTSCGGDYTRNNTTERTASSFDPLSAAEAVAAGAGRRSSPQLIGQPERRN